MNDVGVTNIVASCSPAAASALVNSGNVNSGMIMSRVAYYTGDVVSGAIFGKHLYVNTTPPWGEN